MVKLGDYMAFQFESSQQKENRETLVKEAYDLLTQSVGDSIKALFAHTPVQFMFIPAKSNMTDAIIYTQTNKSGRTTVYSIAVPVSSDENQKKTICAAFTACIADKLSQFPKADELIVTRQQPIPAADVGKMSSPSITFYRQVNAGETNKAAKLAVERTSKCYRAILRELAGINGPCPNASPSILSLLSSIESEPSFA